VFVDVNGIPGFNLTAALNGNQLVPVPEPGLLLTAAAAGLTSARRVP
jgi:hypothetical protein